MKICSYSVLIFLLVESLYAMDGTETINSGLSQKEVEQCVKNGKVFAQLLYKKSNGSTAQLDKIIKKTRVNTGCVHFVDAYDAVNSKARLSGTIHDITVESYPRDEVTEEYYKLDKDVDTFFPIKVPINLAKL